MATKIRLQRHGRKSYAFYSIVIADARAPRDGRFIEKIGTYNPNTNPATVDLNFDRALKWVMTGAQPTDTVRNILSREGVYMKKHLLGGVAKGAFGEAEAEAKFQAWKNNKQSGLEALKAKNEEAKKAEAKARLEAEKKVNEEKAKALAEKKAADIQKRAEQARAKARAAEQKVKAERQKKLQAYDDQARELELESKRLDIELKKAQVDLQKKMIEAKANRADEFVQADLDAARGKTQTAQ